MKKKPATAQKPQKQNKKISPEIEKASQIASHYGFSRLPETVIEKEDIALAKKFHESHLKTLHPFSDKGSRFAGYLEEKISLVRHYLNRTYADMPQPVTAFYTGPLQGNPHMKQHTDEESFNLEIMGSNKSICDAMIIEAAFVILKDRYPDYTLSIVLNSIGDKDATTKFSRELANFCKKEMNNLGKACKEVVKKDMYSLFLCSHASCQEIQERAPKPITYLSEGSRNHFKEVLEYLESLNLPYSINHTMIGSRSYCTDTIFEIHGTNKAGEDLVLAIGERYNHLAKKVWNKKEVPAVGVSILIHPHFVTKIRNVKKNTPLKSKFFFIQFGFDAKLKSLALIETLRQAGISVEQSLSKDKLSVQLGVAEKLNVPYILIMGQKEAIDNSVVVRSMATRIQETVSIEELPKYLKKLK
ncbi:MAG TPA: His/Gly/Thr/Pro-type tRNA ligase C-terminal domain-containing protein [Candidatus Paceibacterota bacterium]|nr:His/Gly/Thr/Pro-type tRNA ligase C-terminal domain-containing protein [Candidatus Paceibacterota bacterium]